MPNWCSNELVISGEQKQIDKFTKIAKKKNKEGNTQPLSLMNFYPEPDYTKVKVKHTFPDITGKVYNNGTDKWWDWRIQHWGTKWDVESEVVDEWDGYIMYRFDTAWSPPVKWLEKVAKDYPELTFRLKYEEEGVGFLGVAKATAGVTTDQEISL